MSWKIRGLNPGGGEIFHTRPDRSWGPPSLLYNGYRVFPGGKAARAWRWPPTCSAEVKETIDLYLYSTSRPSWPVLGWTVPFPLPLQGCLLCYMLSDRGLCEGPITRTEESYWVWCVWVWSRNLNNEDAYVHQICRAMKQNQRKRKAGACNRNTVLLRICFVPSAADAAEAGDTVQCSQI